MKTRNPYEPPRADLRPPAPDQLPGSRRLEAIGLLGILAFVLGGASVLEFIEAGRRSAALARRGLRIPTYVGEAAGLGIALLCGSLICIAMIRSRRRPNGPPA